MDRCLQSERSERPTNHVVLLGTRATPAFGDGLRSAHNSELCQRSGGVEGRTAAVNSCFTYWSMIACRAV